MPRKNLKNKPLIEAILELRWILSGQEGSQEDPHYRLLLGRFSERIQDDYPFHEPLPTTQMPDSMAAYLAQHRFRIRDKDWPLIQIGPGIMTVNETDSYNWEKFKLQCEKAVTYLFEAHPAKNEFKIRNITLRYINAVEVNYDRESVFVFLREKMKTTISLPDSLFSDDSIKRGPTAFNWQVSFPQNEPGGLLTLRFAMGRKRNKSALIWETLVQTAQDGLPDLPDQFSQWLTKSHDLTDDWFFKLIVGDLERSFSNDLRT